MRFSKQEISGVWLIEGEPHVDSRGSLRRHFCQREFSEHGLVANIAQTNVSQNIHQHTLRGFHYQDPPHGEAKTISCFRGAIYNIVVDVQPGSATFRKWLSFEISAANQRSLQIPPGCASAFLTLQPDTVIHYYMSEFYNPESYRGFRYNDSFFDFRWPAIPAVISEKDLSYPDFKPL